LAISREIATLLGGEIRLHSKVGEGSEFTLYMPAVYTAQAPVPRTEGRTMTKSMAEMDILLSTARAKQMPPPNEVEDDREHILVGDRTLLIVEDDATFARIMLDLAHERGFKGVIATRGDAAVDLAKKFHPDAVTLDIALPDTAGWFVLDQLKHDPATRHIPVHIISIHDNSRKGFSLGAASYLKKTDGAELLDEAFAEIQDSIERRIKNLLVVENDEAARRNIVDVIGNGDVHTTTASTVQQAITLAGEERFDCVVLDASLAGLPAPEFIEALQRSARRSQVPLILYGAKDLSHDQETALQVLSDRVVLRRVQSLERLLDEANLFLHRVEADLPEAQRQLLMKARETDPVLTGRKVLVVDDDVRNIFALTSVLERHKIVVEHAEGGREGIECLRKIPDIAVVLMDIMMPDMDGYDTMREIRSMERFRSLPIIALTAKAMKGDREKCLEAGASDYITKPVDIDHLLSMLRVWMPVQLEFARTGAASTNG
jgi:CheY-like chemotaxis protein